MSVPARFHAIERTSPKGPGQKFIGTCSLCGKTGLPASAAREYCENTRGLTQDEALLEAIDPQEIPRPMTTTLAPTKPHSPRETFDFHTHLQRQRDWSSKTFGPGPRTAGVVDHIRRELLEIEADPTDILEWIDVVILALDGAWRAGFQPQEIIDAIIAKQTKNEARKWPDWRTAPPDKAIEHDRGYTEHSEIMREIAGEDYDELA